MLDCADVDRGAGEPGACKNGHEFEDLQNHDGLRLTALLLGRRRDRSARTGGGVGRTVTSVALTASATWRSVWIARCSSVSDRRLTTRFAHSTCRLVIAASVVRPCGVKTTSLARLCAGFLA